jgi:large subunit ribosomal protein L33
VKSLDFPKLLCYSSFATGSLGFFFMPKIGGFIRNTKEKSIKARWKVVRVKITLACTECKQRNYNMTKEKKLHPERMETKKYCRFCKKHTLHKETK